ncbi:HisA/HisF-related TIM barrel protein [Actinomadura fulvescens]|uniref:Imidazole glycerol phosphate synthase subunit HisF n=1 Tax=Actinomadura fulvescens TaxID=46160 RepID=A0ABP6CEN0_9ACTN
MPQPTDHAQHSPIIPTIDISGGRTIEPAGIPGLADPSDPLGVIECYRGQGATRVFLDVQDSWTDSAASLEVIRQARTAGVSLWVTVANGLAPSIEELERLIELGVEAVGLSTTSVERPSVLHTAAQRFGADRVLGVMNVQRADDARWNVVIQGDETETPLDAVTWAQMLTDLGAGHILPNSLDQEGTGAGYDLDLVRAMVKAVHVPVIASGGCGTLEHLREGLANGATYVLTQKMLHDGSHTVDDADSYIRAEASGA